MCWEGNLSKPSRKPNQELSHQQLTHDRRARPMRTTERDRTDKAIPEASIFTSDTVFGPRSSRGRHTTITAGGGAVLVRDPLRYLPDFDGHHWRGAGVRGRALT